MMKLAVKLYKYIIKGRKIEFYIGSAIHYRLLYYSDNCWLMFMCVTVVIH